MESIADDVRNALKGSEFIQSDCINYTKSMWENINNSYSYNPSSVKYGTNCSSTVTFSASDLPENIFS